MSVRIAWLLQVLVIRGSEDSGLSHGKQAPSEGIRVSDYPRSSSLKLAPLPRAFDTSWEMREPGPLDAINLTTKPVASYFEDYTVSNP